MKNTLINKELKTAITLLFYAVMAVFIGWYVVKLDFSKLACVRINWWFMIAAVPVSILSRVFLPSIWVQLIKMYEDVRGHYAYWQLNYIYAKSWLGRYIPGKVAWVGGKIYFAMGMGIGKTTLGVTALVEAALQLLTALLIGVAFLFVSGAYSNFSVWYNIFFLSATIVGLIAVSPPVFNFMLKKAYKLLKKRSLDVKYTIKLPDLVKVSLEYTFVNALSGLPIYFLVKAAGFDIGIVELLYISGAFIFAGAIGTLAIFAPSGLGVREGVIMLFLVKILPAEISFAIVVLLRIWSVLLDVIYWLLSYVVVKLVKER